VTANANATAPVTANGPALVDAGLRADDRWLVRHISLSLARGRFTAIIGPNGSGKSTVLRLLAGLWKPTEGRAELDGSPLPTLSRRDLARRVAVVPQDTHMAFAFTVRETVAMGRHAHVDRFAREGPRDRQAVADAMTRADIAHLADRLVTELSGGERQRVLIARCLATEADTILLDEPLANLDIAHALDVLTLCRALADEGRAVALALHDLNAATAYATDAVLLKAGTLVGAGPARQLLAPDAIRAVFDVDVQELQAPDGRTLFTFSRPLGSFPTDRP
jgi:iron complex transport system ATP-binding protein